MHADPKSAKRQSGQAAFAVLGSVCVKAVHKHVDEIDPWYLSRQKIIPFDPIFPLKSSNLIIELLRLIRAYTL